MVESRSPKPLVVGSSPTAPAKTHSDLSGCVFLFPGKLQSGLADHHPLTDSRKQISGVLLKDSSWTAQAISAATESCPGFWVCCLSGCSAFHPGQDKAAMSVHSAAALAAKVMPCVCVLPGSGNRRSGAGSAAYLVMVWVQVCIR